MQAEQSHIRWAASLFKFFRAVTVVMAICEVLTSCEFSRHRSAPGPASSALKPSVSHSAVPATPQGTTTTPAPIGPSSPLAAEFTRLRDGLPAKVGVVISAVGAQLPQLVLGDWASGPAWSTMKVPLTMTALREASPPTVTDAMRAAITESDNAAAESIWEGLGDPIKAAHQVEGVLQKYGDPTTVEWRKVRPQFTAFGQTIWSLTDQVRFLAAATCDSGNAPILTLMGQVEGDQRWGLGVIPGTRFKGGWGPSPAGGYLVRQLGVLKTPSGLSAVAIATEPASGTFSDGTQELTEISQWLNSHLAELPAGQCIA